MRRCFDLATRGHSKVAPNPLVGCVLVNNNQIIGEGYHEAFGKPHAEVMAINSVADRSILASSTIYINLEPCSHFGKTPPCVDLILKNSIPEVIISNLDPNPLVHGAGVKKLLDHGIRVKTGILKNEGQALNRRFFTFHQLARPYVTLKWAQSKDGYIGKYVDQRKHPVKISCESTDSIVHKWRSEEQSILVGHGTVISDNPLLTVRKWNGNQPIRVIIEENRELLCKSVLSSYSENSLLISSNGKRSTGDFMETIKVEDSSAHHILEILFKKGVNSVLVEGGSSMLQRFIDKSLWDECRVITGEIILNEGVPAPNLERSAFKELHSGTDIIHFYKNN